ncbi:energy transducer TonB [Sphingomonas ginsenosidimutans]|uniref:Energy transducer TonB n=2 Tax=Sphingomonas ginsenosidimutans TaxID=862134 RepID=A0A2A4HXM8_9SPHN|nr:energy transducer TonB [Sphingomonas ginsenosidimutans]
MRAPLDEGLAIFRVAPPPPRPAEKVVPKKTAVSRPSGRAAPPNIRSQATQVAAPRPIVVVPLPPPPITVALKPFAGDDATQGATTRVGPGTGAGGVGDGTGSGGWGDGDGGGMDETPPVHIRGRLRDADYPGDVGEAGFQGTVSVKFLVWVDGRVRDCAVTRSSGNATLDATTCRLIEQRFRYRPSRDADGRAVPAWIVENHQWVIEPDR